MKKTRHAEEQIAFALKQAETGERVALLPRIAGVVAFYRDGDFDEVSASTLLGIE